MNFIYVLRLTIAWHSPYGITCIYYIFAEAIHKIQPQYPRWFERVPPAKFKRCHCHAEIYTFPEGRVANLIRLKRQIFVSQVAS